jgi:hypothetical protein
MLRWLTSAASGAFSTAGIAWALLPGGVVIDHDLPFQFPASNRVEFHVTVHKGALDYFGRLHFDLPEGVALHPIQTAGGSFSSDPHSASATVSWLSLPENDPFTLRMELDATGANQGEHQVDWQFAFVENNTRQVIEIDAMRFRVGPPKTTADDDVTEGVAEPERGQTTPLPRCTRTITALDSNEGYRVQLDIEYLPEGQFSKLVETLPLGCTPQTGFSGSSVCTHSNQTLQFLWFESPKGRHTLEYTLPRCTLSNVEEISGVLSFVKGDDSHEIVVINTGKIGLTQDNELVNEMNPSENGVSYRVQIAAGHSEVVTDYFAKMFDFAPHVSVERHEGWMKYTTGGFNIYDSARNERERLTANHDFRGPFVAAYIGGQRITVQHALSLTDQGWLP